MTVLSDIFALGVVFCVLVFLHEAGHFFTAKAFGIRVYTFSFGLGWRLLGVQWRDGRWRFSIGPLRRKPSPGDDAIGTDYRVSAIPFGGYVTLQGEHLSDEVTGDPREFRTRPRWQQLIVYSAGVVLNLVLAFVLATALIWKEGVVIERPSDPWIVEKVMAGTSAEQAGLLPGDRLIAVEGRDPRDEMTLFEELLYAPGLTRTLLVERDGTRMSIQFTVGTEPKHRLGVPGFTLASSEPIIQRVERGSPAERGGLLQGDRIVRVGDIDSPTQLQLQAFVEASAGSKVPLVVVRGSVRIPLEVTPMTRDKATVMGVGLASGQLRRVGLLGASVEGARYCWRNASLLFLTIKKLARGHISPRAMSGPLELAQVSGMKWRQSTADFIELLAFVSIQLGIMNLLPIPVLDGGHIFLLLIEEAIRRPLPEMLKEWVMLAGLAVLLLFGGVVIWFDVLKTFF